MKRYELLPKINEKVTLGGEKRRSMVLAGRLAERGGDGEIWFDGSHDFVVLEVGKRGSGKSYGLGSLLEAFATIRADSPISKLQERRAVVLLDPLDVHWSAIEPLRADGPPGMRRQHEVLAGWGGLQAEPIDVKVFMPAGHGLDIDHPGFESYRLPVSTMTADDWALLLRADLVTEPRGQLIDEAYRKVTELGWRDGVNNSEREPKTNYSIDDLMLCIERDDEIQDLYVDATRRSVLQPLRSFQRQPLFQESDGTPMTDVAVAGRLTIMSLGRLAPDLRTVVTSVFVRKLRSDRMYASQIRRRLDLVGDTAEKRAELEHELARHVPRTILAIDEAQILMPSHGGSMAREALDDFVLEGRNFGLSLWLATQRPKGAISDRAISQIDTLIVHRLSVADDVQAVIGMLQSAAPQAIRLTQGRDVDTAELIRGLEVGQAIFSSANTNAPRFVVGQVRPRMVAHGGEAF